MLQHVAQILTRVLTTAKEQGNTMRITCGNHARSKDARSRVT